METNYHGGHRERLKKRFLNDGMEHMEKQEILEMMLFFSIPRRDTNALSHELLNKFGSISTLLDAPIDILRQNGLSESTIAYLKMIPDLCRLYMEEKRENRHTNLSLTSIAEIVQSKFIGRTEEAVLLMLLDSARKSLFCEIVNRGSVNGCEIYSRKMLEIAIANKAAYAIIAHNHPSGSLLPSKEDILTTRELFKAFSTVKIELLDHIIVSNDGFFSFRETGFMEI